MKTNLSFIRQSRSSFYRLCFFNLQKTHSVFNFYFTLKPDCLLCFPSSHTTSPRPISPSSKRQWIFLHINCDMFATSNVPRKWDHTKRTVLDVLVSFRELHHTKTLNFLKVWCLFLLCNSFVAKWVLKADVCLLPMPKTCSGLPFKPECVLTIT